MIGCLKLSLMGLTTLSTSHGLVSVERRPLVLAPCRLDTSPILYLKPVVSCDLVKIETVGS
jgi:hypothetical protein